MVNKITNKLNHSDIIFIFSSQKPPMKKANLHVEASLL